MKLRYIAIGLVSVVVAVVLVIGLMWVNYNNAEVSLRNLITAKAKDNSNEFDNMWKKIEQVSKVAVKDRDSLSKIFNGYAEARTGTKGDDKVLMRWIQESIPNVNQATFANLQNTITSARDNWTMRQKEIIDYQREHNNLRTLFPSSLFVGNRPAIEIVVVTSDKTEKVMKTGKDNDVEVFK